MTFSLEVKEEISVLNLSSNEKLAQLSAIIKNNGYFVIRNGQLVLTIKSEISKTAQFIYKAFKDLYNLDVRFMIAKKTTLKKNNIYIIEVEHQVREILRDLEVNDNNDMSTLPTGATLMDNDCIKAYIRGCFLACGSINRPTTKYYHLELNLHDEDYADFLQKTAKKAGVHFKEALRRNNYVLYLKKSEEIADFLRFIGAHNALLKFEDERITRDFYNSNNRLSICEISNEVKVIEAGRRQCEAIEKIKSKNMLGMLTDKDRYIAELRLENPEMSMLDLAELYSQRKESISKSGINHAMIRILDLSKSLK